MKTRTNVSSVIRPAGTAAAGILFAAAVAGLMVWLAGGFSPKIRGAGIPPDQEGPYRGPTAAVRRVSLPLTEEAVGSVKPVHEMVVTSRVAARITELQLAAGQEVSPDEVLVRLDDRDMKARLAQTRAVLDGARATRDQAIIDRQRLATAYAAHAATKAEFDHADLFLKNAESDLVRAMEVVNEAQALLEYTTIRAPARGVVVDRKVNVGDTVMPGQVLATLYDPSHMQLVASVRETLTARLKVGQTIGVRMDALHLTGLGTIAEIVPEADSASRTFQVKVTGHCPPGIYSGMFGRIIIPVDWRDALLIPGAAVRQVGQLVLVDSFKGGRIERHIVRLGRTIDHDVEVLSGLQEGEQVVLRWAPALQASVPAGEGTP
jgi:RND family efflux transporter MFP subunit